ncbi:hypothetical protein HJG60_009376 [Phyllostomus discolor]|uniref:Uncharacterized protein n=1 Tax=Phyllostomus discolor TaxID=89673 RepID=A0A834DCP9_9CHIR|nr:hypothetical protein HJG60_009376 [Phyllostomus discolor]
MGTGEWHRWEGGEVICPASLDVKLTETICGTHKRARSSAAHAACVVILGAGAGGERLGAGGGVGVFALRSLDSLCTRSSLARSTGLPRTLLGPRKVPLPALSTRFLICTVKTFHLVIGVFLYPFDSAERFQTVRTRVRCSTPGSPAVTECHHRCSPDRTACKSDIAVSSTAR